MNKTRHYIRTILLMLLLVCGGTVNEAWGKVTYHILTQKFSTRNADNTGYLHENIRVEAFKCTSDVNTVGLPDEYKSPLLVSDAYTYYIEGVTSTPNVQIYANITTLYTTYDIANDASSVAVGTSVADGTHIYVTYDFTIDANKSDLAKQKIDLNGDKEYNIQIKNSSNNSFLCYNMIRNNRPAAVRVSYLNGRDLGNDNFAFIDGNPINHSYQGRMSSYFHFIFKLTGNDPYNIKIETAYNLDGTYVEPTTKVRRKQFRGASLFAKMTSGAETSMIWLSSEADVEWMSLDTSPTAFSKDRPGFYKGNNNTVENEMDPVFNSFTILNHKSGQDFVLIGTKVNVNGHEDWQPKDGNYAYLMYNNGKDPKMTYKPAKDADHIQFYEVRKYDYHLTTSFYDDSASDEEKKKHTLTGHVKWSDYFKTASPLDTIPGNLKRKYVTFEGAYQEKALTNTWADFEAIYINDEPTVNKVREAWLKYETVNMPFVAGTATTAFNKLKWYNIYANKEEEYIAWYDKTDSNKFNTKSNHSKFVHDSHFAFIGDPYELYVVNRQASEDNSNNRRYLKLGSAMQDPLVASTDQPDLAPYGMNLIEGSTYYTSTTGEGQTTASGSQVAYSSNYYVRNCIPVPNKTTLTASITYYKVITAVGNEVADGSNYFVDLYTPVGSGTTLTARNTYYKTFTADGTEVSNGSNYFVDVYLPVINETTLTAGNTYYTSSTGDGKFTATGSETVAATPLYYDEGHIWEIVYDDNSGNFANCFRLRKFKSFDSPVYIGWDTSGESKNPLVGKTEAVRLTTLELPMMYYTYYMVDNAGRIAVKATEEQIVGTEPSFETIPEIIRSPFLNGATLSFETYKDKTTFDTGVSNGFTNRTGNLETLPYLNSIEGDENEYKNHIFVSYTDVRDAYTSQIDGDEYNVQLFDNYIYYHNDGSTETIKSINVNEISGNAGKNGYLWMLSGGDPYAMTIAINIRSDETGNPITETKYLCVTNWSDGTISWGNAASATRFIIKSNGSSSTVTKMFEVMATTGVGSNASDAGVGVDASVTYFNIGRSDGDIVKVYSNAIYQHTYNQLRFQLSASSAHDVTYHLIDKYNKDLLQVKARHAKGDVIRFPATYWSPLVDQYYYYIIDDFTSEHSAGTYILKNPDPLASTVTKIGDGTEDDKTKDIYVLYTVNDLVDMNHTTMYLLKYAMGDDFRQEDGSDNLLPAVTSAQIEAMKAEQKADYYNKYRAVYPYCNGDANFNVYGQYQYDVQQEGAASTRTRWAWYVQSSLHDPYHVKILSRQTETYKGLERSAYFATMQPEGYSEVVNMLVWPNISGVMSTDYMVLGTEHNYQLVTSYEVTAKKDANNNGIIDENETEVTSKRYVVDSFEQYWKTYDLIRRNLLKDETAANPVDPADVPDEPSFVTGFTSNRTYLTTSTDASPAGMGWHAYSKMAKAKRWNGYNKEGAASKGWESREHWFQTVKMGSGYFDLIPVEIAPALILLDQHGWEIMRKPLPTGPDDPNKEHKYDVLRRYDSPMVKEYFFWASAKKRSGYHQYYCLDKRIGGDFTSTSLTSLPPYDSENVKDNKGNQYDQYVTYTVKDEYAQSYQPGATPTAVPFLIRQGNKLAVKATSGTTIGKTFVDGTPGVAKYIMDKSSSTGLINELWYVKPNVNIDREMGYPATPPDWKSNPNAYEETTYSTLRTADLVVNTAAYQSLLTDDEKKAFITKYGYFSFSNGFDPYNIQISSQYGSQYFTMAMTGSYVEEGEIKGDYSGDGGSKNITQAAQKSPSVVGNSYDNSNFAMTNQTFMAVQDADGNMQLMPRFDHTLRVRDFRELVTTNVESADPDKLFETQTQLYRPFVYNYRIIDNEGREALRYKWAGELVPQTPEHLKSPFATNFKYYSSAIYNDLTKKYSITESTDEETSPYEITAMSSMAGAGMSATGTNSNFVYVRYAYNEEADHDHVLLGKWLTMELNGMDAQYDEGVKSGTKPATSVDLENAYKWHWKFLKNSYSAPDPYAVQLFNRSQTVTTEGVKVGLPLSANVIGDPVSASSSNAYQYFALLSHTDGSGNADGYALAVARTGLDAYPFLNGRSMSTTTVAKMEEDKDYSADQPESGFTSTSGTFHANDSRIVLTDDVTFDITYHVYTNGTNGINAVKYGDEAISEKQLYYEIAENEFVATLPEDIRSPLLPQDWFLYYETKADMGNPNREIKYLYGLYDNDVYVRYQLYDPGHTDYKVPNAKTTVGGHVARDPDTSNDSSLGLDGKLPYNIIWYDDNMMKSNDNSSVGGDANQPLQHKPKYEWRFEGDDPYAIKIKSVGASTDVTPKYISSSTDLTTDAQTFMLLPKDGYEYGVLAKTGNKDLMLSLKYDRSALELTATPQQFIIFTLATLRVVYHLVIANIKQADGVTDGYETIAWRDPAARGTLYEWLDNEKGYDTAYNASTDKKNIKGTSMRDLSDSNVRLGVSETYNDETLYYCHDVGRISLGDTLRVPNVFYRPNVVYTFFVRDICDGTTLNTTLNDHYKGMEITSKRMGLDLDLIGKTIYINIVYSFNGNLDSNSGDNFVLGLNENKWYTLETVVDNKTYLAQYTNAWGFELKEGRGSHYTNDFLWSPIGDPYGFQFFNRYMDVNSGDHNLGEKNRVITTIPFKTIIPKTNPVTDEVSSAFENGKQIVMGNYKEAGQRVVVPGGKARTSTTLSPGDSGYDSDNHVKLADIKSNSIYELLDAKTPGYFRIHPVANYQAADSVFFHPVEADDDGDGTPNYLIRLTKNDETEFTFGLSKELLKPYFDRAGYVGGLKKSVYDELVANDYNPTVNVGGIVQENGYYNLAKTMLNSDAVASAAQLRTAQTLVYNSNNIVPFTTGYYRLHSPLGISGIDPARYASGYTHKTELTSENPMHFYEKNSDEVRQFTDFKDGGFTPSPATQGDITIPPVERDPASIFYFEKTTDYPSGTSFTDDEKARYNLGYVGTEGLRVKGTVVKGTRERFKNSVGEDCAYDDPDPNKYPVRAKAVMTSEALPANAQSPTADSPTPLFVMDLGGGVLLIHDNYTTGGRQILKYLSYDYSNDEKCNENTIYDLKLTNYTHTDHAKWCMQPVQSAAKKGVNEMGLRFTTSDYTLNNGGDGYYYTTFYAPFDVLLTDASKDVAYISEVWDTEMLHLRKVGRYNKVTNGLPEKYKKYEGCNQFVPAGTPVIIRSSNTSVTMALPTTEPSTALAEYYKKSKADGGAGNIFSGVCLEQILTHGADYVYVFGLPFENPTKVTKDGAFETNGKFTVEYPTSADTGVGFYINVNYNRETGGSAGEWIRNNKCVLSNKIYIRPPKSSSSRQETRSVDFIPVVFDDDDVEDEPIEDSMRQRPHDNRVYDMLGRCVATPQEVAEGTWRNKLAPGIYILNGRKIRR